MTRDIAEGDSFAFTNGVHGDRPTFALTRARDGNRSEITLYELAPERVADARQERFEEVGSADTIVVRDIEQVIVGGERPDDISIGDNSPYEWDGWCAIKIATLRKAAFSEASHLIKSTLQEAGYEPETVLTGGSGSLCLPEGAGVRLSIAFRAMKPVRRRDRLRAIARGIEGMSLGECYYWHAKARAPTSPSGVKALRTLLSDHIN